MMNRYVVRGARVARRPTLGNRDTSTLGVGAVRETFLRSLLTRCPAALFLALVVSTPAVAGDLRSCEQEFRRVVEDVRPSVVTVIAYTSLGRRGADSSTNAGSKLQKNVGSGVVIDGEGHILTTTSVIGSSRNLFVRAHDGTERPAVFLGADRIHDLVLLKVNPEGLSPAPFGQPSRLERGGWAIVVGESSGDFPNFAFGAFTAVASAAAEPCLLEMSTQLYPGNTGGAVANADGEVVGVVLGAISTWSAESAGGSSGSGAAAGAADPAASPPRPLPATMSVAIPIDRAQQVALDLAQHGTAAAGYLGVRVRTPAPGLKDLLNFESGVLILATLPGSPAAAAGIEAGDVILSFCGATVRAQAELVRLVAQTRPGTRCTVELLRGDLRLTREVTVGATPPGPGSADEEADAEREAIHRRIDELQREIDGLEEQLRAGSGS